MNKCLTYTVCLVLLANFFIGCSLSKKRKRACDSIARNYYSYLQKGQEQDSREATLDKLRKLLKKDSTCIYANMLAGELYLSGSSMNPLNIILTKY